MLTSATLPLLISAAVLRTITHAFIYYPSALCTADANGGLCECQQVSASKCIIASWSQHKMILCTVSRGLCRCLPADALIYMAVLVEDEQAHLHQRCEHDTPRRGPPLARRLEAEVGADGVGAVADHDRQLVRADALRGVGNDGRLRAQAGADQVVVHRADGQQRRDGRPVHRRLPCTRHASSAWVCQQAN